MAWRLAKHAAAIWLAVDASGIPDNDIGAVDDESPVPGIYNPQMEGEVAMCTDGMFFDQVLRQCYEFCADGYEEVLDQCYEKGCKKGWTEVGLLCKKNGITPETKQRKSYKRDSGQPARCKLGESFGPNALEDNGNRDFTVVMASDVQLPWGSCTDQKNSDEGVKCAIKENYRLVQGIHEVQERLEWKVGPKDQVNKPLGVFIAGDLTSYGRPWQFNLYRQIWETRKKESKDKNIKLGVWPSLGNHDYFNNVQSCHDFALREEETWDPYLSQSCAQRMVAYIRASVAGCGGKTVNPNFGGHVDHYEKKSAGYAVKYGRIRFAVLHNYPTYRREELVGVASTMGFLEDQIALAEQNDEYLVLVMHDGTNHFGYQHWFKQVERYDYYSKVMTGSRTIAVFQGHLHPQGGMKEYVRDSRERTDGQTSNTPIYNAWGEPIPLVLNWAAEYERFILTQFNIAECYWRYGSVWVGHDERQTEFFEPSYSRHQQIFVLPNCTVDPNYTWSPPTTTVFEGQGEISSARWSFNSLAALASLVVVWAFFGV